MSVHVAIIHYPHTKKHITVNGLPYLKAGPIPNRSLACKVKQIQFT